jgi:hypothetical protein
MPIVASGVVMAYDSLGPLPVIKRYEPVVSLMAISPMLFSYGLVPANRGNRCNARLSTGPVTEEGKRKSRQNALVMG